MANEATQQADGEQAPVKEAIANAAQAAAGAPVTEVPDPPLIPAQSAAPLQTASPAPPAPLVGAQAVPVADPPQKVVATVPQVMTQGLVTVVAAEPVSDQNAAAKATIDNVFGLVDQFDSVDAEIASYEDQISELQGRIEMARKRKETLPAKALPLLKRLQHDLMQYADIFGLSLNTEAAPPNPPAPPAKV